MTASTWICSQSFTKVPRSCRLQLRGVIYFEGSDTENEKLVEEFAPGRAGRKAFRQMVAEITHPKYQFLFINMDKPIDERFRRNFTDIIDLGAYARCRGFS